LYRVVPPHSMSEEEIDLTHSILYRVSQMRHDDLFATLRTRTKRMNTCGGCHKKMHYGDHRLQDARTPPIHLLVSGPAGTTTAGHGITVNRNPFLTKEFIIATLADSGSEMALQVPVGGCDHRFCIDGRIKRILTNKRLALWLMVHNR
jgi:hypothetical protein